MISFHNISSIAKYERKTLFRSWFFRIFSILSLGVLFIMNMGMVSEVGSNMWVFRAIPSSIPYMNLLILNVAQAIIAVFLASDFLKRDKKLDTTEVIYMRSMTNGDYVIGKTLGNMQVFMILNFAVLGMALIFNSIASGTHIPWSSYLIYILLISIPTLVYIMGLSFLLMSLIRNQAVTFVIILGYIGITLFLVQGSYYYVFDYMSFNIPMLRSGIVGFGNLDLILGHRGIYFCLGAGFIFLTIFLLKRLPQSESMTWFSIVFSIIFIVAGTFLAYRHVSKFIQHDRLRAQAILLNNHYVKMPSGDVSSHRLKLIHKGTEIEASSQMTVVNNNLAKIDSLVFHLNPGLIISETKLNGQSLTPIRKEQLIILPLEKGMELNDSVVVNINYSGKIREEFCYLDIDNEMRSEKYQDLFVINVDKRYAFITPDYLLLTRESGWYPETGVTFSSKDFGWNRMHFTDFDLEVETDTALYAVSQGVVTKTAPGQFSFSPEQPLTQISLAIGKYRHKSMESAGTEFGIWYLEGHDFFSDALPEIKDTIPALVQESFRDFLRTYNLRYPFKRLSIVEVPSQFKSFMRTWTFQQEVVQPEQIFLQEKGFLMRDIDVKTQIKREKRWMEREGQSLTDKDYQVRAVGNIMGNFFREGGRPNFRRQGGNLQITENSNPYFIFPQLYYFSYSVRSSDWPVMNLVLEAYLKSQSNDMRSAFMRDRTGLSEDEMANIALQDRSFEELLADDKQVKLIDNLVKLKGDALFTAIQAKAGETEFTTFLRDILRENKFSVLNFDTLDARLNAQFGISMQPYMNNWFRDKKMPGFLFTPVTAVNTKAGDQIRTMISFSASNTGESDGVVKLTFRLGGPGGGGRPRGMSMGRGPGGADDNINKILTLKPGETKKVSYLFDNEPRGLTINTLTSKNIPQTLMQFFGKVEEDQKVEPKESEETTSIPVSVLQPNEIVVDNEDPGFTYTKNDKTSLLHKIIIKEEDTGLKYSGFNDWHPPLNWTNTTNSGYYGLFVRSAFYVKSGTGDQKATWTIPVKESGHYDVYTHVYPMSRGGRMRGPDGGGGDGEKGEYHYFITHNDGETEQTLQVDRAEPGWNSLGSFYLSPGKATVVLTNTSQLKIVVADAIKVVKN